MVKLSGEVSFVEKLTKKIINTFFGKGPSEETRANRKAQLWGEVESPKGDKASITVSLPNAYSLTAQTSIKIAEYCLNNELPGGYYTPSVLLGADFIKSIPGVEIRSL